jgi:ribonuclease HII
MKRRNLRPTIIFEKDLKARGFNFICGLDEVGRGAWAGPLVAGAVILDKRYYGLRDSKMLKPQAREKLARKIKKSCLWAVGEVSAREVDKLKITKATQLAFKRAVRNLKQKPDFVLADGFKFESPIPCRAFIKGDQKVCSIAAASIVAKVYRDEIMRQKDKEIKGYCFGIHKGYGTKLHQNKLKKLGVSKIHRKSFAPIKKALSNR